MRIWRLKNPHANQEIDAVSERTVYGPFSFEGGTVSGQNFLEMLTNRMFPQLADEGNDYHFQQVAPPRWHLAIRTLLNEHLPNRWIGRAGRDDQVFCKWPARSPDLTVSDALLWRHVKSTVHVPPLPAPPEELEISITRAVRMITPDMLHSVWTELDYRIDVCRATAGTHNDCF